MSTKCHIAREHLHVWLGHTVARCVSRGCTRARVAAPGEAGEAEPRGEAAMWLSHIHAVFAALLQIWRVVCELRRALAPIQSLADAMADLETGRYDTRVVPTG